MIILRSITLTLRRKLKLREIKSFAQNHITKKW